MSLFATFFSDADDFLRDADADPHEVFVGWAGSVSAHLTRIIHVRIRHFPEAESTALVPVSAPEQTIVISEEQWRRAVGMVYERLLLHLRAQAKARAIEANGNGQEEMEQEEDGGEQWQVHTVKKSYMLF